jgi:hypothetical protein
MAEPPSDYPTVTPRIAVGDVAGATTIEAPRDTPYGDRRAMVRDPYGSMYQIANRLV